MSATLRAVIVGGSLGGLTAALVLREAGCDARVYERSCSPLEGRGAGIVLHPSTVRFMTQTGRLRVEDVSTRADRLVYLNRDGSIAHEESCGYRFTSYYTLYQGLLGCLPGENYRLGMEVSGFEQSAASVTARLTDGSLDRCDLLVFADGIHSTGRHIVLPEIQPRYAGYVGWRGTVLESELSRPTAASLREAIVYFVGNRTHILTYPIPDFDGSLEAGRRRINFVWYRNVREGAELDDLLTDRSGVRRTVSLGPGAVQEAHVESLFRAAEDLLPAAMAETVIRSVEPFVQVVFDIAVPQMAFGRVCLIGDAAFAIRPHAAAGTAKAAEDAWKLADAVRAAGGDPVAALTSWERGQLALGRQVLERAREIGDRSQFLGTYRPPDPFLSFGLYEPGDSSMPADVPSRLSPRNGPD